MSPLAAALTLALTLASPGAPRARPRVETSTENVARARRGLLPRKAGRPRPASHGRRLVGAQAPTWLGEPGDVSEPQVAAEAAADGAPDPGAPSGPETVSAVQPASIDPEPVAVQPGSVDPEPVAVQPGSGDPEPVAVSVRAPSAAPPAPVLPAPNEPVAPSPELLAAVIAAPLPAPGPVAAVVPQPSPAQARAAAPGLRVAISGAQVELFVLRRLAVRETAILRPQR